MEKKQHFFEEKISQELSHFYNNSGRYHFSRESLNMLKRRKKEAFRLSFVSWWILSIFSHCRSLKSHFHSPCDTQRNHQLEQTESLLTCSRSLYFTIIRSLRSSSSFRRSRRRISAASECVLRSDSSTSACSPLDSFSTSSFFASRSSSSLKLSMRISESSLLSAQLWTTLTYSTWSLEGVAIFFNIGRLHVHRKLVPKKRNFCMRSAFFGAKKWRSCATDRRRWERKRRRKKEAEKCVNKRANGCQEASHHLTCALSRSISQWQ